MTPGAQAKNASKALLDIWGFMRVFFPATREHTSAADANPREWIVRRLSASG